MERSGPPLHVVLVEPEIPQNTGNVGRLCAYTGCRLHLVHPLGFTITDRHLKRSGMDYWQSLDLHHHDSWEAFWESPQRPARLWLLTTRGEKSMWEVQFDHGDGLVFGNEGHGVKDSIHSLLGDFRVTIPRLVPELRSLNLATAAGIAAYEALRQILI